MDGLGANFSNDAAIDPLFANHLAFFAAHRGEVRLEADAVVIDGSAPFLSSWTPLDDDVPLPDRTPAIRLVPASGPSWPGRLAPLGYRPAETLAYMELGVTLDPDRDEVEVRRVADANDARAFASVQAAAFLTNDSPHHDWWIGCFDDMALRNFARNDQSFFLVRQDGAPASVLLTVHAAGVSGLYAVATAPVFQKRGLSTHLLRHACADAVARGSSGMILQAMTGSYAHGFYARLGFVERYRSQVWRRQ